MRLEKKISDLLINHRKTLSIAESCSGGFLSNLLTNIPGSTKFFKLGLITYSNESKQNLLKVPLKTLKKHGAVSTETAETMAQNVRRIQQTDFGVAITGIAGPTGETKKKPLGLTFIAVATSNETICLKCIFSGTRTQIKAKAAKQALRLLLEFFP